MQNLPAATRIVWYEIIAFSSIIAISWANEFLGLEDLIFGASIARNWTDPILETTIIALVGIPTILVSSRLAKRLHYLEGFLRICAWCRKVGQDEDWVSIEDFLNKKLNASTSHGICPACCGKFEEYHTQSGNNVDI